jgi:hypothetical protein
MSRPPYESPDERQARRERERGFDDAVAKARTWAAKRLTEEPDVYVEDPHLVFGGAKVQDGWTGIVATNSDGYSNDYALLSDGSVIRLEELGFSDLADDLPDHIRRPAARPEDLTELVRGFLMYHGTLNITE